MGEIVKGAVKEELTKLCVRSYEALSLPHHIITPRNIQKDWLTPDHDGCNLLITTVSCCNEKVVKTIYAAVSQKEFYTMPGLGMNFLFFFLSTPEQRTILTVKKKTGHNVCLVKSWIPSSFV